MLILSLVERFLPHVPTYLPNYLTTYLSTKISCLSTDNATCGTINHIVPFHLSSEQKGRKNGVLSFSLNIYFHSKLSYANAHVHYLQRLLGTWP